MRDGEDERLISYDSANGGKELFGQSPQTFKPTFFDISKVSPAIQLACAESIQCMTDATLTGITAVGQNTRTSYTTSQTNKVVSRNLIFFVLLNFFSNVLFYLNRKYGSTNKCFTSNNPI